MSREFPSAPVVAEVVPLNAGDVEQLLSYWAEDATVTLVGAPFGVQTSRMKRSGGYIEHGA